MTTLLRERRRMLTHSSPLFYSQFDNQVKMDRKSCFCIFFIVLLISPGLILAKTMKDLRESKNKRQAQALLPLSYYTGITVSAPVFAALVAAYGIYAVTKYAIKKGNKKIFYLILYIISNIFLCLIFIISSH